MIPEFTAQELQELKSRFNNIVVNESVENEVIVHTLSSGRIVKGVVTMEGVLQVKSVSNFLCG
jgi:flagella basal body P-ring formation protein FlgA